ncbi:hypothetical protein [Nostoc sp.]|uniref:hypothetical protein n=1 Tax=Nostoc sp. TaxID=1180 RepID=UPI002FF8E752
MGYHDCPSLIGILFYCKSLTGFFLIYIAQYRLFHGPFQVEGRIGGVIYFEDIKVGLLAVSMDYPTTDAVKYSRFSEIISLLASNHNDRN